MIRRMALARRFVVVCAAYNLAGAAALLVPGSLDALGVHEPASRFWLLMPAVFAAFVAGVLLAASRDVERYAAVPFWNGVARLVFAVVALGLGYAGEAGAPMVWMAIGDVFLAAGAIVGLPLLLRLTPRQLLLRP